MGTLIDSSVLIAAERGRLDLPARLLPLGEEPIALAAISASELLHGVQRATTTAQKARRQAFVEHVLTSIEVVSFDLLVARVHAELTAALYRTPIGAHDAMIAATALSLGYQLATRDLRSFLKVPGLRVARW